jgi:hypothetical protein
MHCPMEREKFSITKLRRALASWQLSPRRPEQVAEYAVMYPTNRHIWTLLGFGP